MTQQDNGGAAFPSKRVYRDGQGIDHEVSDPGMTLRDYFAGQALAGRMATGNEDYLDPSDTAERCYRLADALLAARSVK